MNDSASIVTFYKKLMLTFDDIFSITNDLLAVGGIAISAAGLITKTNPFKAVKLALRSRFALKPVFT